MLGSFLSICAILPRLNGSGRPSLSLRLMLGSLSVTFALSEFQIWLHFFLIFWPFPSIFNTNYYQRLFCSIAMKIRYIIYLILVVRARLCTSYNQILHLRGVTGGRQLQDFSACTSQLAKYEDCVNNLESIQLGATCTECIDNQLPTQASYDFCTTFNCQETFIECGCSECATEATNFLLCIFGCADDLCQYEYTADETLTTSPSPSPDTPPSASPTHPPDPLPSTSPPKPSCGIQQCVLELQACVVPCERNGQERSSQDCSIQTCVHTFNVCAAPCLL